MLYYCNQETYFIANVQQSNKLVCCAAATGEQVAILLRYLRPEARVNLIMESDWAAKVLLSNRWEVLRPVGPGVYSGCLWEFQDRDYVGKMVEYFVLVREVRE
jgi:hypothetical protein